MEPKLASIVHGWHDFYGLVGTASATLVGVMFVVISIGAGVFSKDHQEPMKAYVSPTVVHFSSVLVTCMLTLIPTQTWLSLSLSLGCLGVGGLGYCTRQWFRMLWTLGSRIDVSDRIFYVFIPGVGYLLSGISAVTLFARWPFSAELMAAALVALLLAGIRNAWNMTIWLIMRSQTRL